MIFGAMTESYCAEQSARMTAMDSATKSATDMIHALPAGVQPHPRQARHHPGDHRDHRRCFCCANQRLLNLLALYPLSGYHVQNLLSTSEIDRKRLSYNYRATIIRVAGPVVDVQFTEGKLPCPAGSADRGR